MLNVSALKWIAWVLVMIGGINWGLVGLFNINIVTAVLGMGLLSRLVFILVGISAGYLIYLAIQKKDMM